MTTPHQVLVVEDDAKIAQLLLDCLRNDGFEAQPSAMAGRRWRTSNLRRRR